MASDLMRRLAYRVVVAKHQLNSPCRNAGDAEMHPFQNQSGFHQYDMDTGHVNQELHS